MTGLGSTATALDTPAWSAPELRKRGFFIVNLLVRIHFIKWTGLEVRNTPALNQSTRSSIQEVLNPKR